MTKTLYQGIFEKNKMIKMKLKPINHNKCKLVITAKIVITTIPIRTV